MIQEIPQEPNGSTGLHGTAEDTRYYEIAAPMLSKVLRSGQ